MASSSKFPTSPPRREYPTSTSKYPTSPPRREYPSPPPIYIPQSFPYDVFLNFRGKDTRNNFIGHLYDRLVMAGIRSFMDDPEIRKGGEISLELMRAIEESRIYIVVFSINYASSRWCLDELVKIMECKEKSGRVVIPVFYDVKPHEVRGQIGSYEKAFKNHESIYNRLFYRNQFNMVKRWRVALTEAANLSGFDMQSSALGSESRLIGLIIKEVLAQVKPKRLFVAKHPVGLDSRLNDVHPLIGESNDVHLIGMWGMGGSGKTVLAKVLYNKIHQNFDLSCFLANVREVSEQSNGLVYLQEQLISEFLRGKKVRVGNVDGGISFIEERFSLKKALIVLDDVDNLSQVNALAGHRNWFGGGSLIIITTRDLHLLSQLEVDERYEVKELNYEESLELFSWHSFQKESPQEPYGVIADKIVAYSCGLPLALVVLGSYLFGRTVQEWESAFEMLQKIPPNEIQKILKISYDGLDNDEQRDIFLDIACFFIGADIDYVTEILNGCDFSTEIGIRILKDRCLLTVNMNNELRMHDLIRDMGREIIRQQFPKEPGKRSRLWSHLDVTDVLMKNMGTEAIEGATILSSMEQEIHINAENFVRMHNLRLIQMDKVNIHGSFIYLSGKFRWIRWQDCSLNHLPYDLQVFYLVALDMQHSRMISVWERMPFLRHLKILNLSHSKRLASTPDFKSIPSLVTLILEGCTRLYGIDPSIGCLKSLLVLNLKCCKNIRFIPTQVCYLESLASLDLSGCSNLKEFPRYLGRSKSLRELYADETTITELPSSLIWSRELTSLSLRGCTKMKKGNAFPICQDMFLFGFAREKALRRLILRECNLSDEDIPDSIGILSRLKELDLAGNNLSKLPDSFRELTNLESLWLDNWNILQSMSGLPPNLEALVPVILPEILQSMSGLPPNLEALVPVILPEIGEIAISLTSSSIYHPISPR